MYLLLQLLYLCTIVAGLKVDVSDNILKKSGETLTFAWQGLSSPSEFDWVGIYTPADSIDENFIGYVLLSSFDGWKTGNGSLQLPLVNMRSAYQLRLFRGVPANDTKDKRYDEDGNILPSTETRLAVSTKIEFKNFNEPTQVHLSLTSQAEEMRIMFVTRDLLQSHVLYGYSSGNLDMTVATEAVTYKQDELCDYPGNSTIGWRDPGYIHSGVLRGLEPSKRYFYKVGSKEGGWSETFSFVSAPEQGDDTLAFLFGDLGTDVPYKTFLWTQAESMKTREWLLRDIENLGEDAPTFISHIGDISYARGYAWLWDEFFHRIQPLASQAPYTVCIGNHEYDWPLQPWKPDWAFKVYGKDGGGECGVPYSLKFQMPGNSSLETGTKAPPTKNLYFSITYGVVHFVYISTETDFLPGSSQFEFLKADLAAVDRSKVPYLVVLGHRPMYTSNHEVKDFPTRQQMLQHLEPVFVKYKVDMVLWGHVHKYERTCGIRNFTCGDGLPVHVVIGMGGQDWQPSWETRPEHPEYPIFPQPEWSLFRSEEFGYVKLHATTDMLKLSYVGNRDGEMHDSVEIRNEFSHRRRLHLSVLGQCIAWFSIVASIVAFSVGLLYMLKDPYPKWNKVGSDPC